MIKSLLIDNNLIVGRELNATGQNQHASGYNSSVIPHFKTKVTVFKV
jgi:hypothetical protein